MRQAILGAAALLGAIWLGWVSPAPLVPAAPLAQATATPTPTNTPTPTATPRAAAGWDRTDHPNDVRCYTAWENGQPYGGCVVVTP